VDSFYDCKIVSDKILCSPDMIYNWKANSIGTGSRRRHGEFKVILCKLCQEADMDVSACVCFA
jgi:hypothetical protein